VFFARDRESDGELSGVFIQRRDGLRVEVVTAARAAQRSNLRRDENYLVLFDGVRYVGRPGTPEFQTARFREHGIPLPVPGRATAKEEREQQPTLALLGSAAAEDLAEVHWRFAAPASVVLLTLLAIPLARSGPRAGRYARLGFAILIYVIYSNLLGVGRTLVEDGRVPASLGLWWVHGLVLAVGAMLLFQQMNGFRRLAARWRRA
jgi:lipopolysaccharide export system permease protein